MPASRLFVAFGLVTLLVAVSVALPGVALAAVGLDALLLAAFAIDLARARATVLRARRTLPPLLVQGSAAAITVEVEAGRDVVLLAREALHPALGATPLRSPLRAGPGSPAVWRFTTTPRRRGEHAQGPLTVRVLGPWGLAWSQRDLIPTAARRVYPQVRWDGEVGKLLLLAQRHQLGQTPLRTRGLGREPYALREYRPGDPLTRIHWKASARHDRLISREDTWERGARLVLLLDCARAMAAQEGLRSKLDHALAASLALLRVAVARGDRVTVVAFAERVLRVVRVRPGTRGVAQAYDALYDLEARLVEPAYDAAAEQVARLESRSSTVVVLTSVVDLAAAESLREATLGLRRRHRTLLVNLEDPELDRLAHDAPATVPEAFAQTASLGILLGNRRLGRQLRHAGVEVVSVSAERLAWSALQAYLGAASRPRAVPRVLIDCARA